ncbi:hypothetical protein CSQ91_02280 [Janthinobacterium sp. BJB301]|uniref:reverse transcriptase family protein n=1 Tax=Janthinobacterium sp. BJB301 TaxID=1560195 RepID=UPI000C0E3E7B|nr:reverse transcriptase family protein [Janthinobacterium sp. BJB301]PHV50043.1 hypothetical protein CSQ91_02280 [Janthinobacterium sp. BJB301]
MTKAKLKDLTTLDDVARACGIEPDFILGFVKNTIQKDYFYVVKMAKRGRRRKGEYRVVFQAREKRLSDFHRSISMIVSNSACFGDHVQGFRKKHSARTNAEHHLGAAILLHADIKGFFDAITTAQVKTALISEGSPPPVAELIAKACTIDGFLRQGTRCSPVLANLVCVAMDQSFLRLARSHTCNYTRYADDLTFSGERVPCDEAVREILAADGFALRDGKCYRQFRGKTQYVTGLTVADPNRPRLPKQLKHDLRTTMYFIERHGLADHWERIGEEHPMKKEAWLQGMLRYAWSIEPNLVRRWQYILDRAFTERAPYIIDITDEDYG